MTTQELEAQLSSLTPVQKAQAIQFLLKATGSYSVGIHKTPGVCGGDACVGNTRIPVWSLVNERRLGMSDAQILEAFPSLSTADLVNTWVYADTYPEEIEIAIRENEEVMQEVG
ncbi:MAG: DUF433 domain-containing protein [Symploca sp. SIO3E6]|nr:DUF433 domain-containing protein [Caldora sp. SIO3E6]